jgi:hypothetical protein
MDTMKTLIPLDIPVYPHMAEVLGYRGDARFVAFFQENGGSEGCYHDGDRFSNTIDRVAFSQFLTHPRAKPHLAGFPLVAADGDGASRNWIVLDREESTLLIGPPSTVMELLLSQWNWPTSPPLPLLVLAQEELDEVSLQIEERFPEHWTSQMFPSSADHADQDHHRAQHTRQAFVAWLDEHA